MATALPAFAYNIDSLADTSDTTPGNGVCGTGVAGTCTLRAAIEEANGTVGSAQITIGASVSGNVTLGSALPVVTHPILLNAQVLTIVGSNAIATGLDINTTGSQIAINIQGFINNPNGRGIILRGTSNYLTGSTISGNLIGVQVTGTSCAISPLNVPGMRNVITGNGFGISISGANNTFVEGNNIGVNAAGTNAAANGIGILLSNTAQNTTIGGSTALNFNVISGNTISGIRVANGGSSTAFSTTINGNIIGPNALQSAALPNGIGIEILGGSGTTVGVAFNPTPVNAIAGNGVGIVVDGAATSTTVINTNAIGQTTFGTAMGNTSDGIRIHNGTNTVIGSSSVSNVISSNGGAGIVIDGGSTIKMIGNKIGTNAAGTVAMGNANGIVISGFVTDIQIGDYTSSFDANTISGNTGDGVQISALGTSFGPTGGIRLYRNFIGTTTAGTAALPNARGVLVNSTGQVLLGEVSPAFNTISGNTGAGVEVQSAGSAFEMRGNVIGLSSSNAALPNQNGVLVTGGSGFYIGSSSGGFSNVISGNTFDGIKFTGGNNVTVSGNRIGTDNGETLARGNGANGIHVLSGSQNIGPTVLGGQPNVIVSNATNGIWIETGASAYIDTNRIGLNTSDVARPNNVGVRIDSNSINMNGNVISGNTNQGLLTGGTVNITNSKIGTNNAGTAAVANGGAGIETTGFGTTTATGNVISGNTGNGVFGNGGSVHTNLYGNIIGLNANATAAIPNGQSGVSIQGGGGSIGSGNGNTISGNAGNGITINGGGAATYVQSNYIGTNSSLASGLGNGLAGVAVTAGVNNTVIDNYITNNGGLGIDLSPTGVTPNDAGDGDNGANSLQNFPVLTTVVGSTVNGTLNSNPNSTFRINVYGNDAVDASGSGEGKYPLGFTTATTDGSGNATFAFNFATYPANARFVSATASRNQIETSEFSNNIVITPDITIGNVTQNEGNAGTSNFVFTVTLSQKTTQTVTVNYQTLSGTASPGSDFTSTSGTLTIPPETQSGTITVVVNGDTTYEVGEMFSVTLSGATNANIADNSGTGTIINDDAPPSLSINDVTVTEGNAGTVTATFTVSLSAVSALTAVVNVATQDGTATTANSDYLANSTSLTFAPGQTSQTFAVTVSGDNSFESNETFSVVLSGPTNATISDGTGIGTINNDDAQPSISINDVTVNEGNAGSTTFIFTISLSNSSGLSTTVDAATSDGSATSAGGDYTARALTTVVFAPGQTSQTFTVTVNGDTTFETNETFNVTLSGPLNATIADGTGQATITNDDSVPAISIDDVTLAEGNAGTTAFTFTVSLSNASVQTVTVTAQTADGSASSPFDYLPSGPTTITFNPLVTTQTFTVNVMDDGVFEPAETFFVNLSGATNATIADNQGIGTITNDDPQPTISINDVAAGEGNSLTFTVSLSTINLQTITVDVQTADDTASSASDYTAAGPTTLTFAPGVTTQTFTVNTTVDNTFEPDETFFVNLSGATNATIADGQGVGTITNDDGQPAISVNDVPATEGSSLTFTVSLSNPSSQTITVSAQTADDTASSASDYTATGPTTLTFGPGVTTQTFTVNTNADATFEPNETFFVNLSGATNATIADNQGLGTITNDDSQPTITINDVAANEGTTLTFTVTLSNASSQTITVSAQTADGTALGASDYTATGPATLTFAPGATTQTFSVNTTVDTTFEPNETFVVNLSAPANATIADNQGTGTINNDDAQPTISINDVAANEGTALTFTVSLSNPSTQTITVSAQTADGTALSASDYTATGPTTLTFAPGLTSQTFTVNTTAETAFEPNETFFVNLTAPVNATIADNQGLGTITNDDAQPTISINDVAANEGTVLTFTVTLSNASSQTITVSAQTADGTALSASDYTATGPTTLTFAPGITTQTFTVNTTAETTFEPNETFFVNLSGATNATIADNQGLGTINNDDPQPAISINDVAAAEGTALTFTVTLSNASSQTITVSALTADGTALSASDYTATGPTTLTFAPGVLTQTFTVNTTADTIFEANETFVVNLSGATNATIADNQGIGTINNDDAQPTISINDVAANEGIALTFTVTLSNASSQTITVSAQTADGTASSASDYTANGPTTLTFAPGVLTQTFNVNTTADTAFEADETFFVNLTAPVNATIGDNQGLGTITNDDPVPSINISDVSVNESAGNATFTVTLTSPSSQTVTVSFSTADSSATQPADYTVTAANVTFAPGIVSQTVSVPIVDDALNEAPETFFGNLTLAVNGVIADGQGVATIADNDPSPSLSISNAAALEGQNAVFTVTLSPASGQTVTVAYTTTSGSATAGSDFTTTAGTLTFAPGQTTQTISVPLLTDGTFESSETFTVTISGATNASIATATGTGTVADALSIPMFDARTMLLFALALSAVAVIALRR